MAESFLLHAIHHPNTELGTLTVFDYLLECAAHPDYEVTVCLPLSLEYID